MTINSNRTYRLYIRFLIESNLHIQCIITMLCKFQIAFNLHRLLSSCFSQGERSFFLRPGEHLENGIQDVYVLSEEEGLVLRAVEAFIDTEGVKDMFDHP